MKIGDKVRLSTEGIRAGLYPKTQDRLGTITSITGAHNKIYIGVLRDGSKASVRYSAIFWERAEGAGK